MLAARKAELGEIDAAEEMLARAQQNRGDRKVHLVAQTAPQIVPDGGNAAANADILAAGGFKGTLERGFDAIRDKVKSGAASHRDRWPWIVREHEDGNVIGRVVAPPAFPGLVRPGPTDGPEHVSPQDPGADIGHAACRKIVVGTGRSIPLAEHGLKRAGRDKPSMQRLAAHAQRVLEALLGACTVAVERYRKALHAQLGHGAVLP